MLILVALVALFALGAVVNRRSRGDLHDDILPTVKNKRLRPDMDDSNTDAAPTNGNNNNVVTRFLSTFPFALEIVYWNFTYWVSLQRSIISIADGVKGYQMARAYSATRIRDNKGVETRAIWHALQILALEKDLGIAIERDFQLFILRYMPWLMRVFAFVYHSHIIIGVAFIVYCFTYLPFSKYACIRRTLFLDNWIAFVILSLWRCMPPRLLPYQDFGMIDILHRGKSTGSTWSNNRFQLTIAAMPSLHFGTSMLIAWSLWKFSPHRWIRAVCWLWPALMLSTILATANHWLLDALVGGLVPVLGWRLNNIVLVFVRIEALCFSILGVDKPELAPWNQRHGPLKPRQTL